MTQLLDLLIDWIVEHSDDLTEKQREKLRALSPPLPSPGPIDGLGPFIDEHGPKGQP